jgi:hypothetical protein
MQLIGMLDSSYVRRAAHARLDQSFPNCPRR